MKNGALLAFGLMIFSAALAKGAVIDGAPKNETGPEVAAKEVQARTIESEGPAPEAETQEGGKKDAERKKKSATTFCVEVRPSGYYQPFELCEKEDKQLKIQRPVSYGTPVYNTQPSYGIPAKATYPTYATAAQSASPYAAASTSQSKYVPQKSLYQVDAGYASKTPAAESVYLDTKSGYQAPKKLSTYEATSQDSKKGPAAAYTKSETQTTSYGQQQQQYRTSEVPVVDPSQLASNASATNEDAVSSHPQAKAATAEDMPSEPITGVFIPHLHDAEHAELGARESDYGAGDYSYDMPELSYLPIIKPSLKNVVLQKLSKKLTSGIALTCQPYVKYVKKEPSYTPPASGYSSSPSYRSASASYPEPATYAKPAAKSIVYSIPVVETPGESGYDAPSAYPDVSAYIPVQISEQNYAKAPPAKQPSYSSYSYTIPVVKRPVSYGYQAPQSYAAPAPAHQSYSAPAHQSYSAPSQYSSYSAPAPAPQKPYNYVTPASSPSYNSYKSPGSYKQAEPEEAKTPVPDSNKEAKAPEESVEGKAREAGQVAAPTVMASRMGWNNEMVAAVSTPPTQPGNEAKPPQSLPAPEEIETRSADASIPIPDPFKAMSNVAQNIGTIVNKKVAVTDESNPASVSGVALNQGVRSSQGRNNAMPENAAASESKFIPLPFDQQARSSQGWNGESVGTQQFIPLPFNQQARSSQGWNNAMLGNPAGAESSFISLPFNQQARSSQGWGNAMLGNTAEAATPAQSNAESRFIPLPFSQDARSSHGWNGMLVGNPAEGGAAESGFIPLPFDQQARSSQGWNGETVGNRQFIPLPFNQQARSSQGWNGETVGNQQFIPLPFNQQARSSQGWNGETVGNPTFLRDGETPIFRQSLPLAIPFQNQRLAGGNGWSNEMVGDPTAAQRGAESAQKIASGTWNADRVGNPSLTATTEIEVKHPQAELKSADRTEAEIDGSAPRMAGGKWSGEKVGSEAAPEIPAPKDEPALTNQRSTSGKRSDAMLGNPAATRGDLMLNDQAAMQSDAARSNEESLQSVPDGDKEQKTVQAMEQRSQARLAGGRWNGQAAEETEARSADPFIPIPDPFKAMSNVAQNIGTIVNKKVAVADEASPAAGFNQAVPGAVGTEVQVRV